MLASPWAPACKMIVSYMLRLKLVVVPPEHVAAVAVFVIQYVLILCINCVLVGCIVYIS